MKLIAAIRKEGLLLVRDKGGLAILFLMPMVLVVVMAVVQDAPFRDYQEHQLSVLFVDNDKGTVSQTLREGMKQGSTFVLVDSLNGQPITADEADHLIHAGEYQIGVIVHEGLSAALRQTVDAQVDAMMSGLIPGSETKQIGTPDVHPNVTLLLDPTTKSTFRSSIRSALKQFLVKLEAKMIVDGLTAKLAEMTGKSPAVDLNGNGIIRIDEQTASNTKVMEDVANNSTQHNVPAWTVFAMFFIVIPLAGNMVRERTAGTIMRLRTMPASMFHFYAGKLMAYSAVGLVQAILMISVGIWLLPALGLAKLDLGSGMLPVLYVSVVVALAATGYGLLVGTLFKTLHQAAIFGMVTVVIMAALGGIWVPLYIMSDTLIGIGHLSPMNWAMESFNDVFLRGMSMDQVMHGTAILWLFGSVCFITALMIERKR